METVSDLWTIGLPICGLTLVVWLCVKVRNKLYQRFAVRRIDSLIDPKLLKPKR